MNRALALTILLIGCAGKPARPPDPHAHDATPDAAVSARPLGAGQSASPLLRPELTEQDVAARIREGTALMNAGKVDEALALFRTLARNAPGRAEVHRYLGWTLMRAKRPDEAERALTRAEQLAPGDAWTIGNRGIVRSRLGRSEDALDDLDLAIELDPADRRYRQARVQTLLQLEPEAALIHLNDILADDSDAADAVAMRSVLRFSFGDLPGAAQDLERLAELTGDDADGLTRLAGISLAQGEHDQAVRAARRALVLDPRRTDAYAIVVRTLVSEERLTAAKKACDDGLRVAPRDADLRFLKAAVHAANEDHEACIRELTILIKARPDAHRALAARGVARAWGADTREAIADLSEAVRLRPSDPTYYILRSAAHLTAEDDERAADDLDRAIMIDANPYCALLLEDRFLSNDIWFPFVMSWLDELGAMRSDSPCVHATRAWILFGVLREEEGFRALTRAIELETTHWWPYFKRAEQHEDEDRFEAALADLTRAHTLDPSQKTVWEAWARVLLECRKLAEAREWLDGLVARHPDAVEPRLHRALVLIMSDEVARARADAESVLVMADAPDPLVRLAIYLTPAVPDLAVRAARRAIEFDPHHDDAHEALANALRARGDKTEADAVRAQWEKRRAASGARWKARP